MDKLQKQILFWVGLAFIVILGAFVVVMTSRTLETATTTNTVSFNGEGKVTAKPDIAMVDLSVVTDAKTSKAAQDDNSKKSTKLIDFLKSQDIDEKDIKTTSYNIQPQYSYPMYPTDSKILERPQIIGYQVNQTIEVKIRDLEKVDAILDGVVATGVNQVYGLRFSIEDPEKLKEEAREKAIKDAKEKAGALEDQLDIKLGRIINFSESGNGSFPPFYYDKVMSTEGRGGGDVPSVQIGENEIIVNVNITYQIK